MLGKFLFYGLVWVLMSGITALILSLLARQNVPAPGDAWDPDWEAVAYYAAEGEGMIAAEEDTVISRAF